MTYLTDTSALTRIQRHQVDSAWIELAERGQLPVCEPVLAEALLVADTRDYAATERKFATTFPPVIIPDGVWELSAEIRRELAQRGAHRGLSVADLIIAATAIKLQLTVLHEDRDYETVARFMPELKQRRVSAGVP